ncbi:MAG: alpha/beta-type small acid-soluble spore protein [Firmicutes bacterium]|nr:alpha/beta-type small acid-soluble spore protein [Bacillota bacterium]
MGTGQKKNQLMVTNAYNAMEQFKYETANELGIQVPDGGYWGHVTSRDCGAVGGNMVRKMIAAAEQALIDQAASNAPKNF